MSFAGLETSLQDGRPIRLYQFQRGPLRFGYTNADRNVSFNSLVFRAVEGGISDDGIRQTGDATADVLTLTVPASLDVAQMYRVLAPAQTVTVIIYDLHYGDNGYLIVWMGQIAGVKFSQVSADIQCQTLAATLERSGLRLTWSRSCPHALYDQNCRVQRINHRVDGIISSLNNTNIEVPAALGFTDKYFSGGYVEWISPYGLEQRGIELHSGTTLTLFGSTFGLSNGQAIAIYPGCDRLFTTCQNKFNNHENYGGCPHMPGKSPFDGTPVF